MTALAYSAPVLALGLVIAVLRVRDVRRVNLGLCEANENLRARNARLVTALDGLLHPPVRVEQAPENVRVVPEMAPDASNVFDLATRRGRP